MANPNTISETRMKQIVNILKNDSDVWDAIEAALKSRCTKNEFELIMDGDYILEMVLTEDRYLRKLKDEERIKSLKLELANLSSARQAANRRFESPMAAAREEARLDVEIKNVKAELEILTGE